MTNHRHSRDNNNNSEDDDSSSTTYSLCLFDEWEWFPSGDEELEVVEFTRHSLHEITDVFIVPRENVQTVQQQQLILVVGE